MEATDLFINLIFSGIGIGYFSFGKRRSQFYFLLCGLVLCVFPYFVEHEVGKILTGVFLTSLPFLMRLI